jgi:hypothetical protein
MASAMVILANIDYLSETKLFIVQQFRSFRINELSGTVILSAFRCFFVTDSEWTHSSQIATLFMWTLEIEHYDDWENGFAKSAALKVGLKKLLR